ncbi:MAG: alanine racemase [Propionibacteriaceae bacterium]|jgi:alanine racemase|nr:alanine racemase [Propionibacteriaceae bacterium]
MAAPETYARIDLGALGRNLQAIRRHVTTTPNTPTTSIRPTTPRDRAERLVLLPVKANAYGHGLSLVARAVQEHRWADWLGVASVDEGLALRQAGVTLPILKLSGAPADQVETAIDYDLRLTIVDQAGAAVAQQAAQRLGTIAPVHLKIDTGMRRIGVEPATATDLASFIEAQPNLELEGVFTHLATADDPAEDDFTTLQLTRFTTTVEAIEDRLARRLPLVHAANSGAVLAHPNAWFDLVRPGILSYGYYPSPVVAQTVTVEPVLSWVSHLSFVKPVAAGETVSYGRTWTAPRDTIIGTVPVGYGDGYSRTWSNRVEVIVAGARRRQVGRICMDQLMVDLGPDSTLKPGQPVTLIGREGLAAIGADDLAAISGTISYEVLTGLGARVPRVMFPSQSQ